MMIDIFVSMDRVENIWRNFEEKSTHYVFQKYEWQKNYVDTIGVLLNIKPVIVVISDDKGLPLMLWPLAIRCSGPMRFLVPLGGNVTDYHAPMVTASASTIITARVIDQVLAEVRKQVGRYDAVMLDKIPDLIENQINPLMEVSGIEPQGRNAHAANLGRDFDAWVKTRRSSGVLKDERRSIRRLGEMASFSSLIDVHPEASAAIASAFIAQKSRRWLESGQEDLFAKDAYREFYLRMLRKEVCHDEVHVSALRLGDEFIACHFGMIYRNRFYYLMPTFEMGLIQKYSPGNVLLIQLLRWCISRKCSVFDFTVGDETYKSAWCDVKLSLYRLIRAYTVRGYCYIFVIRVYEIARRSEHLRTLARIWRRRVTFAVAGDPS